MSEHAGQVALITGGGSGLGAAICELLAADGTTVIVADMRSDSSQAIVERIRRKGHSAAPATFDVSRPEDCEEVVKRAEREFGHIDVLVNSAAVDCTVDIEKFSVSEWDRVLQVNLHGPFYMAKHVFPLMRRQGRGHIVNIASTASKRAWPNASAYHASKWGLLGLSHALHVEGRPHGIKVTAVVAGGMRTPFLLERFPEIDVGVLQDPRNVAETVRFILAQPAETVIPEVMVLPMRETSWP